MKTSDYQWLFLQNVAKLIEFAKNRDIKLTGGELHRPQLMQEHYYLNGKSKTLTSNHGKRLAIDLNVFINGKLTYDFNAVKVLGNYWESLHPKNRWGGDWNGNDIEDESFVDTPHFEMNI
jgi:hypothetical protein